MCEQSCVTTVDLVLPFTEDRFTVEWVGLDGCSYEDPFTELKDAKAHALCISERGAHSIVIFDMFGDDYAF